MLEALLTSNTPAAFRHIQEMTGTSLTHLATSHYGFENVVTHSGYIRHPLEYRTDIPYVLRYFGYGYSKPLTEWWVSFKLFGVSVEQILLILCSYNKILAWTILYDSLRIAVVCLIIEVRRSSPLGRYLALRRGMCMVFYLKD